MGNMAGGAWVEIIAQKETAPDVYGDEIKLALATGADYDEDFNVQPLEVLGHLGAKEYNSHGYSCSISVQMLIAKNKAQFNAIIPNRSDIQEDGQLPNWKVTFRSTTKDATIYAQFKGVVIGSNGQQIQANQFVTMNSRWFAL